MSSILLIECDALYRETLALVAADRSAQLLTVRNLEEAVVAIEKGSFTLVIVDLDSVGGGKLFMKKAEEEPPLVKAPVLMIGHVSQVNGIVLNQDRQAFLPKIGSDGKMLHIRDITAAVDRLFLVSAKT